MLKRQIASLSVCAILLLTAGPSGAFAQSAARPNFVSGEQRLRGVQPETSGGLKASLAGEVARLKADAKEVDFRRLEREQNDPRTTAKYQSGYTKKEKIIVAVVVIAVVVLAVVLALTIEEGDHPSCIDDPNDPFCIS